MTEFDLKALQAEYHSASDVDALIAVARYVEDLTIERLSSETTQVNVLAEIAHQLTRIANGSNKPAPVITAEQAAANWPLKGGMYNHLAVGYLQSLGIDVEIDPNT